MTFLFDALTDVAWQQFWQVTIVAVGIALVVSLFCRRRPHLAYLLWMLVIVKCLTPPIWSSPTGVFSWASARATTPPVRLPAPHHAEPTSPLPEVIQGEDDMLRGSSTTLMPTPSPENSVEIQSGDLGPVTYNVDAAMVLTGLWLCGLLGYAAKITWTKIRWSLLLRRWSLGPDPALVSLVTDLSNRLGLRRRVHVRVTSQPLGPVAYGVLRPTLLLPQALWVRNRPRQTETVLAHELIHIRRGDPAAALVQVVAQILWWFHPLVRWANLRACEERERCCDEEVVARLGCEPSEYAQGLLNVLKLKNNLRLGFTSAGVRPGEVTSKRLEEIMEPARSFHRCTPRGYLLVMLLAVLLLVPGRGLLVSLAADSHNPGDKAGEPPHRDRERSRANSSPTPAPPGLTLRKLRIDLASNFPAISPDGRYLCDSGAHALIVRELATGKKRALLPDASPGDSASHYAISPDSKRVAYLFRDGETDQRQLQIAYVDGSGRRVVRAGEYLAPKGWSPDGMRILALQPSREGKTTFLVWVSIADGSIERIAAHRQLNGWSIVKLSPNGRTIAYDVAVPQAGESSRNNDIFLLAVDEDHATPIRHPADDRMLGWTPDGRRLLFSSDRTGSWNAWLQRVEGGKPQGMPRLVTPNIGKIRPGGFTHDGDYYYVASVVASGSVYTAAVDLEGGTLPSAPAPIHQGLPACPAWSPDGKYLAWIDGSVRIRGGQSSIRIRTLATGEERVLEGVGGSWISSWITWTPDGRSLLVSAGAVNRVDPETGETDCLLETDAGNVAQAELSPDERFLVYGLMRGRVLARDLENGDEKEILGPYKSFFPRRWRLSPDGKRLVAAQPLRVVSLDGTEDMELLPEGWNSVHKVAWAHQEAWAPDGQSVLFNILTTDDHVELWQVSAEGGEPQKLLSTDDLGSWRSLRIHPDGTQIAFHVYTGGGLGGIWVMENLLPANW